LHHIQPDHLGSPRKVIQSSTNTTLWDWPILNNAFGEAAPTGTITLNLRFPGQYFDAETGLHYNYFRDYEPGTGRYVESDPLGLQGGQLSTFAYVDGQPLTQIDFFGLAKSGQTVEVPGTNATVRIDNPHVPDTQRHAHVCQKGCDEIVVNMDGTGSHGTDPTKIKNRKILKFLANKGFRLVLKCGAPVFFAYDWTTGGFGHAVDEATWPVSEAWSGK